MVRVTKARSDDRHGLKGLKRALIAQLRIIAQSMELFDLSATESGAWEVCHYEILAGEHTVRANWH